MKIKILSFLLISLKKIGMRNPLHRKKLQLCLNGLCTRQTEANILDTHWVQSRHLIKIKRSLFLIMISF